jgi:hypothetical protein
MPFRSALALIFIFAGMLLLPLAEIRADFALGNMSPEWSELGALIFLARWSPPVACCVSVGAGLSALRLFKRPSRTRGDVALVLGVLAPAAALILLDRVEMAVAYPPGATIASGHAARSG